MIPGSLGIIVPVIVIALMIVCINKYRKLKSDKKGTAFDIH